MGDLQFKFLCIFLSVIVILIHNGHQVIAQSATYRYHYCQGANYTNSSQFQNNLKILLSSLPSNIKLSTKFNNNSIGRNPPDRVNGILLCRGDLTNEACKICAETATGDVANLCPNKKEFISWYDNCMLRYSNKSIFSDMQISPSIPFHSVIDAPNPTRFNQLVSVLINGLMKKATSNSGSLNEKFAIGVATANFTFFQNIYGLVQCTPDISASDCNKCLKGAMGDLPSCCYEFQGGRVLRPSCNLRYEVYPFYESTTAAPAPAPSPVFLPPPPRNATTFGLPSPNATTTGVKNGGKSSKTIVIIAVVASVAVLVLLFTITICFFCLKKRRTEEKVDGEIKNVESLQFEFSTIRDATDNFSDVNKIGEGGFGVVYKGKLADGEEIAVKRISNKSLQGLRELKNEVFLVAKLQHRNLVRLLGFCFKDEEKLLIYQFMPNTSLDRFLFDPIKRVQLTWEMRYKIIGGIARGLLYLHEESRLKVIHRDLKASNVLLDEEMNPKISDFGMARLFGDQSRAITNRIAGTYGYMAPEYAMHGLFSVKSDVYSFGVIVLEIVSGRRNNSFDEPNRTEDLLSNAWRHWKNGTPLELLDATIRDCFSESEVKSCIHIGLLCVQDAVTSRPTMASVILMLSSYSITLPLPSTPAFFMHTKLEPDLPKPEHESSTIEDGKSVSSQVPSSRNEIDY